ncbi:MAG: DUF3299 domain-containing protein [Planctomycetota bacterium]|jgi:hypothetical protein
MSKAQKGVVRPLWIGTAVVTCVVFGSTVNKCLTCFSPPPPPTAGEAAFVRGERLDAPVAPVAVADDPAIEIGETIPATVGEWGETAAPAAETVARGAEPAPDTEPQSLLVHLDLTFDDLASYRYEYPEDGKTPKKDQIPAKILGLDGTRIAIKGFMIPLKNDGEEVVEFVLVRNQNACCFGIVPAMNEWIHVKMNPEEVAPYAIDIPITVFGKLEIGETYENELLMSIYRMQSNNVVEPVILR